MPDDEPDAQRQAQQAPAPTARSRVIPGDLLDEAGYAFEWKGKPDQADQAA